MQKTTAVVVARFQAQRLTPGHVHLLNTALLQNDAVLLFLGCSPVRNSLKNPVPFVWRKSMVENDPRVFTSGRTLIIKEVHDKNDDAVWSDTLAESIKATLKEYGREDTKLRLYGSRDSSFLAAFRSDAEYVQLLPFAEFSATELRSQIATQYPSGRERDDAIREGMIMAAAMRRPTVYSTVDVAILQRKDGVLGVWLGKKASEKKFRFVGGFAEPTSTCDEEDAQREAKEETGLVVTNIEYVDNITMNDWRYRDEKDKIRTRFFVSTVFEGEPKAADDIKEVTFVTFPDLVNGYDIMPEHKVLVEMLDNWAQSRAALDYVVENNLA